MRRFGWFVLATRSVRENGFFYWLPGLAVGAIGTFILLREWWKELLPGTLSSRRTPAAGD